MDVLIVRSDEEQVVFRLDEVVEVLPMLALSGVEQAEGRFRGLLNLRGQVVPVHELGRCSESLDHERYIVLCKPEGARGEALGLIVDDVVEVVDLPLREQPVGRGRTVTVAQRDQDLLQVVDPAAVVGGAE